MERKERTLRLIECWRVLAKTDWGYVNEKGYAQSDEKAIGKASESDTSRVSQVIEDELEYVAREGALRGACASSDWTDVRGNSQSLVA